MSSTIGARVIHGDCRAVMRALPDNSVDAIVTDPPYEIGFMGRAWDRSGVAFDPETWAAALRVLKPGGHLLAFGATKTFHRLVGAIDDAGFEIQDMIPWLYGGGVPKHRKRLKNGQEPITVARKPLSERTLDLNIARWGVGGLFTDVCRVGGRHPANFIHDGSDEIVAQFPITGRIDHRPHKVHPRERSATANVYGLGFGTAPTPTYGDIGPAARFFYAAKASKADRAGSNHPTIKPQSLMRYLCRLVTPPGGTVLDCFAGSGSTLQAALAEGFSVIGIEQDEAYVANIHRRLAAAGCLQDELALA